MKYEHLETQIVKYIKIQNSWNPQFCHRYIFLDHFESNQFVNSIYYKLIINRQGESIWETQIKETIFKLSFIFWGN